MPISAFHEESAPVEPSLTLLGLEGWPHLRFHYAFKSDAARGGLRLEVVMTFAPPLLPPKPVEEVPAPSDSATADVAASEDDPRTALLERYQVIGAQWETENEVTLDATVCTGALRSAGPESAAACLQRNARAIVAALEAGGATESIVAPELAPLVFALPDPTTAPTSYTSAVLQTLVVTLRFRRPAEEKPSAGGTATTGADAGPPAPAVLTRVLPLPDDAADLTAPSYRTLATTLEAAYAGFGWRVVQSEGSDGDEERELALVRWQVPGGLQFTLSEPSASEQAGFACPRLSPVLLARADISTALLPAEFPTRFAHEERRTMAEFDLDAELARFLDEVEAFLAPERRVRMAFFESGLVKRGMAAKEALADLLAACVVAVSADVSDTAGRDAAREALRAVGRTDLRQLGRIGAVALWRLVVEAPLPLVVHGQFVPAEATQPAVLGGSVRLTARSNLLALAICARAEDGADRVELPGAFRCEAVARVNDADGREGVKLRFVTDADTLVAAPPLRARLPWRTLPTPPQGLEQRGEFDKGCTVEAAKRWWLQCNYTCEPAPVDVLRWAIEFGAPPAARGAAGGPHPDLLDTLVVSQMKLPAVAEEVRQNLPSLARAMTVRADAPIREAIRALVQLMEWVVWHFVLPPEALEPSMILPLTADAPPAAKGSVTSELFNVARCSRARAALQIVRNADPALAPAFRYATRVVRVPEDYLAISDRELPIAITGLPPLDDFMPGDPPPGSLADGLTRLLSEVLSAPGPKAGAPVVALAMQVAFACRLPGSGVELPEVRLPVMLLPPEAFPADRRPDATRRRAQLIAGTLEEWQKNQNPAAFRDAGSGARFVFDLTLFMMDAPSTEARPVLRLHELYFPCTPG
jgi:hypothetical protein